MTDPFLSSEMEETLKRMRTAFAKFAGRPLMDNVCRIIENTLKDILMLSPTLPMQDLMVELGMVAVGCGCPRKVCEMLKALSLLDLEFLHEHCGAGPGNMIWLEWAARHGQILGWGTKQESMPEGVLELSIELKEPVNFIKIDLTLEKTNA